MSAVSVCDACAVAAESAATRGGAVECVCGRWHGPKGEARAPRWPEASVWIPRVPGLLPRIAGRAICLEPERRAEPSGAHDLRDDALREAQRERGEQLTLLALDRLRGLARGGREAEAAAAVLWAAYALTPLVLAKGAAADGPVQHAARCSAVALGAAAGVTRRAWRALAAEAPTLRERVHLVVDYEREEGGAVGAERRVAEMKVRTVSGARGPAVDASAVSWGAERLAPLWSPGAPPPSVARAAALGWAPAAQRAEWEALRGVMREAAVVAWGDRALRAADAAWRGEDGEVGLLHNIRMGLP